MEGKVMVAFSTLNVGDVVYDCHHTKMGNTTRSQLGTWLVKVLEIDVERRRALCSWNGNRASWWSERKLKPLRRSKPKVSL
jgi:hypothetical protein